MKSMKERIEAAKAAVEEAKAWEWGKKCALGTDGWETWKGKAREALAKVGAVLEDAYWGEGRAECEKSCNATRKEFGLGPLEEMPWDGVNELVGWDVVIEREG